MQSDTTDINIQTAEVLPDTFLIAPSGSSDSIFGTEQPDSFFHTVSIKNGLNEIPYPGHDHPAWVAGVIVLCFILLAWGRLFFRYRLGMIFRSVFAKNYANQLIREGNLFNERIALVLFLIYLAVISLFVYLAIPVFEPDLSYIPEYLLYPVIFGFFLGLWFLKVFIVKSLSRLFNTTEHSRDMLSNMYLFNLFAGITLLPIVACMAYAQLEIFFYIGLIIIVLIYFFRIIREAIIGFSVINFSVLHLILYLCTLEILPMIVLAKILTGNMIL
ncbi:MAG: DUF4271 domain-containing protein [Bacteroidales bacterium]|nr:DUF4271 domain-containing protein [Bacteroidales bacterium]